MNRGVSQAAGYTIVEALIFLAITGLLFVSVATLVSGQQSKTQFDQAVREAHQKVDDILNDVSTGLYTSTGNISCSVSLAGILRINSVAANRQGINPDCLFIGRAIQFLPAPAGAQSTLNIYTVVGRANPLASIPGISSPTALQRATPVVIAAATDQTGAVMANPKNYPDAYVTTPLSYGLKPSRVYYVDSSGNKRDIGWIAFVNSLEANSAGAALKNPGNLPVSLYVMPPVNGTGLNKSSADTAVDINTALNSSGVAINPSSGAIVCFDNFSRRGQNAKIVVGANQSLTTDLVYEEGSCDS